MPTVESLLSLVEKTAVSLDWLLTGQGSMYIHEDGGVPDSQQGMIAKLTNEVLRLNEENRELRKRLGE